MENDIVYYHKKLINLIHKVEKNEEDKEALKAVKETFLTLFDMIKMILISKQDRYYGVFLMNLDLSLDFTMYCDASVSIESYPFRMCINPLLIGLRSLPEIIYIICHEIEHLVLKHPVAGQKYNPKNDPKTAYRLNIAMDASINDRLTHDSENNNSSVISQPDDLITSAYLHETYEIHLKELQAFDYYFERLPNTSEEILPDGIIVVERSGKEIVTDKKRKGKTQLPLWFGNNDFCDVEDMLRNFAEEVNKSMSDSMRGNLPNYQKEALDKLLTPPLISWQQLLKRFIGTIPHGHRKTRTRLSRRQPERYDISGNINDRIIKIVVAIDTSASMSDRELKLVMREVFEIIGSRACEVTVIECDAEIQNVYKAHSVKDISYELNGRGGTAFTPVIEYINKNCEYRDAILIYFTDGMGENSIPRPLTRKVLWVLQYEDCFLSVNEAYGEVLYLECDNKNHHTFLCDDFYENTDEPRIVKV